MGIYVADFMTLFGARRLYKKIILGLIVYWLE